MFVWIDWRVMVICLSELQIQTICPNTHSPSVTLSQANNLGSRVWCVYMLPKVNRLTWYVYSRATIMLYEHFSFMYRGHGKE